MDSEAQLRQEREQAYHDRVYGSGEYHTRPTTKFYTVTDSAYRQYEEGLFAEPKPAKVLEYGCGDGSYAFSLAKQGSHVTGIDISPVAIEGAVERAEREGVSEMTEFRAMNCESLDFTNDSFDMICGGGILHHIDLDKGYSELARTLKPDGRAVFLEPMGHNRLINRYRDRTPDLRTPDEHPLLDSDLENAERYFSQVETHFFNLLSLAAFPIRGTRAFNPIVRVLNAGDRFLFRHFPATRKQAWIVTMLMRGPQTPASA